MTYSCCLAAVLIFFFFFICEEVLPHILVFESTDTQA